ncbi:hypothetical protein R3P38DRAFT_3344899 [Favolaschia claudopus]|uniref:Testicular haploid expressed protein n=1 Tax=Favolaschia claudopus TaxID=2862362 RepID=A0AAW0DFV2_9AGAR
MFPTCSREIATKKLLPSSSCHAEFRRRSISKQAAGMRRSSITRGHEKPGWAQARRKLQRVLPSQATLTPWDSANRGQERPSNLVSYFQLILRYRELRPTSNPFDFRNRARNLPREYKIPQGFNAPQHIQTAGPQDLNIKTLQNLKSPLKTRAQDLSGRLLKVQGLKPLFKTPRVKARLKASNRKTSTRRLKTSNQLVDAFSISKPQVALQDSARQSFNPKASSNRAARLARQALNLKASSSTPPRTGDALQDWARQDLKSRPKSARQGLNLNASSHVSKFDGASGFQPQDSDLKPHFKMGVKA